ncbi:MAG: hypothetical protein DRJ31_04325 [Candidatus Methanomethylicota archaeon]|uniref:TFIIB-type domain-containing protein n=1 Tax=Thermoproteota archaeon TaxID=2056631 RepID=A0A497EQF3_9CREN|nr:MAG: hypothetical protein DRJ31_04325 [Candidatus Verstraetearchaeota archaeon]RLE52285.1 MAG: hypothetical protein DRJ33_04170 [Candidatus Verstraetearchaeota archaeon]
MGLSLPQLSCPECKGTLKYDPKSKSYICLNCGLMFSREELDDIKQRAFKLEEDERAKRHKEYLKWWFSKK